MALTDLSHVMLLPFPLYFCGSVRDTMVAIFNGQQISEEEVRGIVAGEIEDPRVFVMPEASWEKLKSILVSS